MYDFFFSLVVLVRFFLSKKCKMLIFYILYWELWFFFLVHKG